MSHFAVMVITNEEPTDAALEKVLAPYHEFECTGKDDQYVVDIDDTEELRKEHANSEKASEPFEKFVEYWTSRKVVPFGQKPDVTDEHKYGYVLVDAQGNVTKTVRRTNPNSKWDWWQVGGRWSGMLVPNYSPEEDPANREVCWLCKGTGQRKDRPAGERCNGCGGTGGKPKWPTEWVDTGNRMQLKDLAVETLRKEAAEKRVANWLNMKNVVGDSPIPVWDEELYKKDPDAARNAFWKSAAVEKLRKAGIMVWDVNDLDDLRRSESEIIKRARDNALVTFAVVKDGQWYERGKMGWFGCASDEKDTDVWSQEFAAMLDGLPPTTWVTIVDCHI